MRNQEPKARVVIAKEGPMKREVGLWIDHTKAIIVTILGEKDETRQVRSNIEKYVHFSGGSSGSPLYGTCNISGKAKQDLEFKNFLGSYYEGVISLIRYADSIWIMGPGVAKGELEHYMQNGKLNGQIVGVEDMGMLTGRQITEKVRMHYQGVQ